MGYLTDVLDDTPRIRLLEAFAQAGELALSLPQLCQEGGIERDYNNFYGHLRRLENEGMVVQTGKRGKAKLYSADPSSLPFRFAEHIHLLGEAIAARSEMGQRDRAMTFLGRAEAALADAVRAEGSSQEQEEDSGGRADQGGDEGSFDSWGSDGPVGWRSIPVAAGA